MAIYEIEKVDGGYRIKDDTGKSVFRSSLTRVWAYLKSKLPKSDKFTMEMK